MVEKQRRGKRNTRYKVRRTTISIGVVILFTLFLPMVSGFDFDNVKDYDDETKTITITNAFGLGDKVAEVTLNTPPIFYVMRGANRLVAEFTIVNEEGYDNAFKQMDFYDIKKDMKKFDREFEYKIRNTYQVTISDYETTCKTRKNVNGTDEDYDCVRNKVGDHLEDRIEWVPFNEKSQLDKGTITIGIFTDVRANEKIEWIPTLFGIEVDEWAIWTESLNLGLLHYYNMEEGSGTFAGDVAGHSHGNQINGSLYKTNTWEDGLLGTGINSTLGGIINPGDVDDMNSANWSVSMWIKPADCSRDVGFFGSVGHNDEGKFDVFFLASNTGIRLISSDGAYGLKDHENTCNVNDWTHVVIVSQLDNVSLYVNGTFVINESSSNGGTIQSTTDWSNVTFGSSAGFSNMTGTMDEIGIWNRSLFDTEVTQLYNDGVGITFSLTGGFEVVLNSPADNLLSISNVVIFNCSALDSSQVDNITLIIDGVPNVTLSGSSPSLSFEQELTMPFGTSTWTCNATNDNNDVVTATPRTVTLGFIQNSETFNLNVTETSNQEFELNLSVNESVLSVSSVFNYSSEQTAGTTSCVGSECIITASKDIPLIDVAVKEEDFNWIVTMFFGSTSSIITTSTSKQEISRLDLEICNSSIAMETLNFTTYDEGNLSIIKPFTFDGTFEFWTGSGDVKRNNSFSVNDSEVTLCLSPNFSLMKMDATINYDEQINSSYTDRFYYFNEHDISNSTQLINMYLLNSEDSTSFILKVQDENLLPVSDALIEVHRFYPGEGDFRIVQIAKTDDNGKTIGFFKTETVDYKFIIKKAGVTLLKTGVQKVIPEVSPFTLTFTTGGTLGSPWKVQEGISNLNSSLTFNRDTNIVTYTYIDNSTNFTQARLFVQEQSLVNLSAYVTICNETSALSTAIITCNITTGDGFYIASAYITRTAEGLDKQFTFQIESFSTQSGLLGLFFGWFLILIAVFMFKFNEIAGIWATTIVITLVNILGLIKFGGVFVTSIIGIAIILTWVMER